MRRPKVDAVPLDRRTRQAVARMLRKLSQQVMHDPSLLDIVLSGSRPSVSLEAKPNDMYVRRKPGRIETWKLTLKYGTGARSAVKVLRRATGSARLAARRKWGRE